MVVEDPEPLEFGGVVEEPGVVDDGEVVDEPLLVPGSQGGATCPGVEPVRGSLCTRPELVEPELVRAFVPSCVVGDPLRADVAPLPLDVDEPLPEPLLPELVLLPVLDVEPFAGVHGTCDVLDGVWPLDDPVVELCAAA